MCLYVYPTSNFRKPKRMLMELGMYTMPPGSITVAYFITPPSIGNINIAASKIV
jgi:hypothetical protein